VPIRSPRGRAAAYRAVWGWPLRSPLRLAITVAVVIALAVLLSLAFGSLRPDRPPAPETPAAAAPTTTRTPLSAAPTALPPVAALTPTTLPVSSAPAEALRAAQGFTAAWVNHPDGTTNQQWVAGLQPYTTPEYLGTLSTVDPANIPAAAVTGTGTATSVSPSAVTVNVPTDTLTLVVTVVRTETGWRVSGYDRA
jgi:hypothetical protein